MLRANEKRVAVLMVGLFLLAWPLYAFDIGSDLAQHHEGAQFIVMKTADKDAEVLGWVAIDVKTHQKNRVSLPEEMRSRLIVDGESLLYLDSKKVVQHSLSIGKSVVLAEKIEGGLLDAFPFIDVTVLVVACPDTTILEVSNGKILRKTTVPGTDGYVLSTRQGGIISLIMSDDKFVCPTYNEYDIGKHELRANCSLSGPFADSGLLLKQSLALFSDNRNVQAIPLPSCVWAVQRWGKDSLWLFGGNAYVFQDGKPFYLSDSGVSSHTCHERIILSAVSPVAVTESGAIKWDLAGPNDTGKPAPVAPAGSYIVEPQTPGK